MKLRPRTETLIAWLFILPSLVGIMVFVFIPAVRGIYLSFTNSDLLTRSDFIGLQNYQKLLNDAQFWSSLRITVEYVLFNIPIQTVLALTLAILMTRLTKSNILRGIVFLPYLLPMVMVTMVWLTLLDYDFGPVNSVLQLLGLAKIGFFNQTTIIPSLAWINTWRYAGYVALLFFAGLQSIPGELYEAATIDGANEWQSFTHVTWPLLRPVTVFVLITSVVGSFQVWDSVAVAASPSGGPGGASRVIFWYITNVAFTQFNIGYAAAIAVALFVIVLVIALIQMWYFRADSSDLG
ncbi:MAG TPA: sugar ABC transporter permease [Phototrophicaceae bacterium]|nr:sugar ABC transporter permease [Phototrophicaceae bacterium]